MTCSFGHFGLTAQRDPRCVSHVHGRGHLSVPCDGIEKQKKYDVYDDLTFGQVRGFTHYLYRFVVPRADIYA